MVLFLCFLISAVMPRCIIMVSLKTVYISICDITNKSAISYYKFVLSNNYMIMRCIVFKILANIINIKHFLLLVAYLFYCNNIKTHIRQDTYMDVCWHCSDSKFAYPNMRFYNLHKISSVTVCSISFFSHLLKLLAKMESTSRNTPLLLETII